MRILMNYLIQNPLVAVFFCLGVGFLAGSVKIKNFSFGATAATLLVGIVLALLAKEYGDVRVTEVMENGVLVTREARGFQIDPALQNCFFAMFAFTLGYDVGPAFFRALRSSGIRIVALAAVHALCAGLFVWLTCVLFGFHSDVGVGLLAGAFTFSAATGASQGGATSTVFALTYTIGTVSAICFVRFLAPKLLGIDLLKETKRHLDAMGEQADAAGEDLSVIQTRAMRVTAASGYAGKTVDEVEQKYHCRLEIEAITRDSRRIPARQTEVLEAGDVLTVIGGLSALSHLDDQGLEEVTDPRYFQIRQDSAQIVLTTGVDDVIRERLTDHGIIVKAVYRGGKRLKEFASLDLLEGDILEVYGPEMAIDEVVKYLGYEKDDGITTDIPFFALAVAVGLMLATISFLLMGKKVSMGVSFGTLVVGLLCGWWYDRKPKYGHVAVSTRWFIKSIGLNLYIAAVGLRSDLTLEALISWDSLAYILIGIVLALAARAAVLLIGKYILKLNNVDLLGGICGAATSTPALNALTEHTGSSVYALSYAPGYAVGNVLLTLTGILLANLIP